MSRRWALWACLGLACAPSPINILIPFEAAETSAVVAVVDGGQTTYYGVDAELRASQAVLHAVEGWDPQTRLEVHVLYFQESLATLGLAAGPMVSAEQGSALPASLRALSAVLQGGTEVRWMPQTERPRVLEQFRVQRSTECRALAAAGPRRPLDVDERPVRLVEGPDRRVWLVSGAGSAQWGQVREVTEAGLGEPVPLPDGFRAFSAVGTPDGKVFVGGGRLVAGRVQAEVLTGTPGGAFVPFATRPNAFTDQWPRHLALPKGTAPPPGVYGLTSSGEVLYLESEQWLVQAQVGGGGTFGGLLHQANGELLALRPDGQAVLRVEGGVVTQEATTLDAQLQAVQDRLESIVEVPGMGTFIGADSGYLLRRQGNSWVVAAENVLVGSTIEVMAPFASGLGLAGRYGIVDQFYDPDGYCTSQRLFIGNDATIIDMLVRPQSVVVVSDDGLPQGQRGYFVQWVKPGDS